MQKALLIALTILCLFVSVACSSESVPASSDGPISVKMLNLDSLHEEPNGSCFSLAQGSIHQSMTIVMKSGLEYDDWHLDAASYRILENANIGTCFLYAHTHYQVAFQ